MASITNSILVALLIQAMYHHSVSSWYEKMPGGLKLKINDQFYSFTSDLCSGGIVFKQRVKLNSMCIHGYFFRRRNACKMSDSDVVAGRNYVCADYDAESSPEVQAFIPVTPPELPLEHTVAFYDDGDTLENFRRYSYIKALQRTFYIEEESGSSGIVISNTHNTPSVNIGKICYRGIPDTNGAAYVFNVRGNFLGGQSYGFFSRRCRLNSIAIPWRDAIQYSFLEGYSEPSKFEEETFASLPGLFPDKGAPDEKESGEEGVPDLYLSTTQPTPSVEPPGPETHPGESTTEEPKFEETTPKTKTNKDKQKPPFPTENNTDSGDQNVDPPPTNKPFHFTPEFSSNALKYSPLKLKGSPLMHPSLTNWDPYVEELVLLAKYKLLKDMGFTEDFNFETGRVGDKKESASYLSFDEQADTMWFKIIQSSAEVVKALTPEELIAPEFFTDVVQLFGYFFRNLPDDPNLMNDRTLNIITDVLDKCKQSSKKIKASIFGCPHVFGKLEVEKKNGTKEYLELNELPPSANSFQSHSNDVVVESAWNFIDFALCQCYSSFAPDNINEHHRLFVYMKQFFRQERIQRRWFSTFQGVDIYSGLLPYGNYKVIMYNYDKLKASIHNDCFYSDWIPKPEHMAPKYADTYVFVQSKKYSGKYKDPGIRNNEEALLTGDEAPTYEKPFHRMPNIHRFQTRWRTRRDAEQQPPKDDADTPISVDTPVENDDTMPTVYEPPKKDETAPSQDKPITSDETPSSADNLEGNTAKTPDENEPAKKDETPSTDDKPAEEEEAPAEDQSVEQEEVVKTVDETVFKEEDFKIYEIWNGMAYCLQANYQDTDGKMSMNGFTPSIQQLRPLCNEPDV